VKAYDETTKMVTIVPTKDSALGLIKTTESVDFHLDLMYTTRVISSGNPIPSRELDNVVTQEQPTTQQEDEPKEQQEATSNESDAQQ
jgi:hypothetical protein